MKYQRRLVEISVPDLLNLGNSNQTDTERGHLVRHFTRSRAGAWERTSSTLRVFVVFSITSLRPAPRFLREFEGSKKPLWSQGPVSRGKRDFSTRLLPFALLFVLEMESGSMNMGEQGLVADIVFFSLLSPHSSPSTLPDEGKRKKPAGG